MYIFRVIQLRVRFFFFLMSLFFTFFSLLFFFSSISLALVSLEQNRSSQFLKEKIFKNEREQRRYLSALYDMNQEIKKIRKKKAYYLRHSFLLKKKAQALAKEVLHLEREENKRKEWIKKLFQNLYKESNDYRLKSLFASAQILELDRNFKYSKEIFKKGKEQMEEYQKVKKRYLSKRESLEKTLRKFLAYRDKIQEKEKILTQAKNAKYRILETLRKEKAYSLSLLNQKRSERQGFQYDISFLEKKGFLKSPILGGSKIRHEFLKQKGSFYFLQSGIFYKISSDTVVRSIYEGRVAFAGPIDGYGNLLVLDHGDQYYSVYANLSYFLVKKGDRVSELQEIAKIKKSYQTGLVYKKTGNKAPGLYFEIRHFSEPLDPGEWLH